MSTIPAGYKQTDVGVIPEDWDVKPLGDVADFLDGKRRPVKDSDRAKMRGGIPYYGASGIVDYVNDYLFDEDLVLLGEDGENILSRNCRLAFKISGKTWVNNHAHVLRPKHGISLDYLAEILESKDYKQYNTGTAQPKLNKLVCSGIPVVVPPLPEQRAIAAALSDVDALLAKLDQLIAKKRDLKQATMQQLLTGQTRLPGFSGAWEVKRLGALGFTYGGLAGKTKENFGQGNGRYIPFMNVMTHTVIDSDWLELVDVVPGEVQNVAKKGDLFFNGSSETPEEVGFCSVLLEDIPDLYLNSFCFGFRFNAEAKVNGLFFAYWFRCQEGRKAMSLLAQGATRYNIAKSALLQLEIPQPSAEEQTAIATVLSDMDTELAALEARRDKTRALNQGMMQELLTGRIRLGWSPKPSAGELTP